MSRESKLTLELIPPESGILNQCAVDIEVGEIVSSEIQHIIDQMLAIAQGEQGDTAGRTMVGLAAPQIGVSMRIIIVAVDSTGGGEQQDFRIYINPVIIQSSEATEEGREGCYSTGNICGVVDRPSRVTVRAYDRSGQDVTESHTGFTARIFQHEIDHLNGIRFPDRISDDNKLHWVEPDKFGDYRERWATWPHKCPRTTWEAMKTSAES
jgi:peptide deformylase